MKNFGLALALAGLSILGLDSLKERVFAAAYKGRISTATKSERPISNGGSAPQKAAPATPITPMLSNTHPHSSK